MVSAMPCPQCGAMPEIRWSRIFDAWVTGCWTKAHYGILVLSDGTDYGLGLWPLTAPAQGSQDQAVQLWNLWVREAWSPVARGQEQFDEELA